MFFNFWIFLVGGCFPYYSVLCYSPVHVSPGSGSKLPTPFISVDRLVAELSHLGLVETDFSCISVILGLFHPNLQRVVKSCNIRIRTPLCCVLWWDVWLTCPSSEPDPAMWTNTNHVARKVRANRQSSTLWWNSSAKLWGRGVAENVLCANLLYDWAYPQKKN